MASSKKLFLLLGLLFAVVVVISSEVAASEESRKTSTPAEVKNGGPGYPGNGPFEEVKFDGGPGYPVRGCRLGCCEAYVFGPGCKRCCRTDSGVPDAEIQDDIKN